MHTFINLTNHPHSKWNSKQLCAAMDFGPIIDFPFPMISPMDSLAALKSLAEQYYNKILSIQDPIVLLQGESVFVYQLVRILENSGIPVLACVSQRHAEEKLLESGQIQKVSYFDFVCFRPYWE